MNNQNFNCIACESSIVSPEYKKIPPSTMDSLVQFDELKIISCPECHFSFATERVSDDDLNYYYTEAYSGIAKKVGKNINKIDMGINFINTRYLSQIELIRKFHDLKPKDKILEIGAGIGDLFRTLKYFNIETTNYAIEPGVDAHPTLEMLGVNILKKSLNGESLTKIPKDKFDIVIMSHSLEHFNSMDINDILNGIFNSLKPGGHFLCEVPNANLIKYPNANDLVNPHLTFFSMKSIKKMFSKIGFKIVFLSACGENQNSKSPPSKELLEDLKKKRFFEYKISSDGRVKINIGYHNWLMKKKNKSGIIIIKNFIRYILSIFGLLKIFQKTRSPNLYEVLNDSNFKYSVDREFIRIVGRKTK